MYTKHTLSYYACFVHNKPWPIILKFLSIMLLSSAQKICLLYAQYYAHDYCNYATVHIQF